MIRISNERYSWSKLGVDMGDLSPMASVSVVNASLKPVDPRFFEDVDLMTLELNGNPQIFRNTKSPILFSECLMFDCEDCGIRRIHKSTFSGMPRLIILNLSHNKMVDVDEKSFASHSKLENITLSHNHLRDVPDLQPQLPKLIKLTLSFNRFLDFEDNEPILDQPNLRELYLDNCAIQRIYSKSFSKLPNIRIISMKFNPIVYISRGSFVLNNHLLNINVDDPSILRYSVIPYTKREDYQPTVVLNSGWFGVVGVLRCFVFIKF